VLRHRLGDLVADVGWQADLLAHDLAEHAVGLLLAVARNVPQADASVIVMPQPSRADVLASTHARR
jgi:lactate dehydrogenase-like 2-hydroxyacid dehydrogenase